MSKLLKPFIGPNEVGGSQFRLENGVSLRARNAANSADISLFTLTSGDAWRFEQTFRPTTDNSLNIGTSSFRWSTIYTLNVNSGASVLNVATGNGVTSSNIAIFTGTSSAGNSGTLNISSGNAVGGNSGNINLTTGSAPTSGQIGVINFTSQAFSLQPFGTAAGETQPIRFRELAANGSNFVGLKAPDSIASNFTWTLPASEGTADQVLKTNGGGVLGWMSAAKTDLSNLPPTTAFTSAITPAIAYGGSIGSNALPVGALYSELLILKNTGGETQLKASPSIATAYILELPPTIGTAGQVLKTNGIQAADWITKESANVPALGTAPTITSTDGSGGAGDAALQTDVQSAINALYQKIDDLISALIAGNLMVP